MIERERVQLILNVGEREAGLLNQHLDFYFALTKGSDFPVIGVYQDDDIVLAEVGYGIVRLRRSWVTLYTPLIQ